MFSKILASLSLFLWLGLSWAIDEVRVGCAYTCDSFTRAALLNSTRSQGVQLRLLDLSKRKRVEWGKLDAIVIPGGADINPKFYSQHVEADLQEHIRKLDHLVEYTDEGKARDEFEYNLLREYYRSEALKDFPVLGLCRGMQIMTVALEIPLYVDIKEELGIENRRDVYDEVKIIDSASTLAQIFPSLSLLGYKYHHQGLRVPYFMKYRSRWPNVRLTALSNGGAIAEGLELLDRPALGVQFHPEADNNDVRKAVFNWFIKKAVERRAGQNAPVL